MTLIFQSRPRLRKAIYCIVGFVIAYTLVGFFVVPAIIKSQMIQRLPALTKRQVAVDQVKFNPYALSFTIRGLSLTETNGDRFAGWDEFYVNFQLSSIVRGAWVFDEISLQKPFARVARQADGSFNFSNLIESGSKPAPAQTGPPQPLPRIIIERLHIDAGSFSISDLMQQPPFHANMDPIDIAFTGFNTAPTIDSPYAFTARTDSGEAFSWSGKVSLDPVRSTGHCNFTGLDIKKYSPYLHQFARFEVADGKLDVGLDYEASVGKSMEVTVSKGVVQLTKLALKDPVTSEMVINIPSFSIHLAEASLSKQTIHVSAIKSAGGVILARQNKDGTINLLSLIQQSPKSEPATNTPAAAPQRPWLATIDEIAFDDYAVKFEDKKPAKPAVTSLDQIAFALKNISTASNAPVDAKVSFRLNQTGQIAVNGVARMAPPSADLKLDLSGIDLAAFQPYVEEQLRLAIARGKLDVHGQARYSAEPNGPGAQFSGDVGLTNFATTDMVAFKDFVKLDSLSVSGIQFIQQPSKLNIGEIKLAGLQTTVAIYSNKQVNLLSILPVKRTTDAASPAPAKGDASAKAFPMELGVLTFENCSLHFEDQSIQPKCLFDVKQFDGTIKGISSQQQSTAQVKLSGKVDDYSPFLIDGEINPLASEPAINLTVTITNTDLTAFTPYMGKYAGHPLNKGMLSLALNYSIKDKKLVAANKVMIDRLTLGGKIEGPDATHLPVKLGIALLKDRKGRIELDVPLSGRLDDPKFRVGPIVVQVVVNLLTKAATSPFTLLGSMFHGGEELSYVDFAAGAAAINDTESAKLEKLSKALYERPELNLEITAAVNPINDAPALARQKLQSRIKSLRLKELIASGANDQTLETIQLAPVDYARLIKSVYQEKYGTNQLAQATTNIPVIPQPLTAPTPVAATIIASTPPPTAIVFKTRTPLDTLKGMERLISYSHSAKPEQKAPPPLALPPPTVKVASIPIPHEPAVTNAAPPEIALPDMEAKLLAEIQIGDNDYRDLMLARSRSVQAWLLKSERVSAERMFLIAPKPLGPASKPEQRVNLSLQ